VEAVVDDGASVVVVDDAVAEVDDRPSVVSVSPAGRADVVDEPWEHPAITTVRTRTAAGTRQRDIAFS
jgi:hypothetical protein